MHPLLGISLVTSLLVGCARICPAPPPTLSVAPALQTCPDPVAEPPIPPTPRTVQQLGAWALRSAQVARVNNQALRECAARLTKLNVLIGQAPR